MGKGQRDKGGREERLTKSMFNRCNLECVKIPLSGAMEGFEDDLIVYDSDGAPYRIENKSRKNGSGFKTIERWLNEGSADILVMRRNGQYPLIGMTIHTLARILGGDPENLTSIHPSKD